MEEKTEVSYTIRMPSDLHRSLRILAAYRDMSINKQILNLIREEVEQARAQIPSL